MFPIETLVEGPSTKMFERSADPLHYMRPKRRRKMAGDARYQNKKGTDAEARETAPDQYEENSRQPWDDAQKRFTHWSRRPRTYVRKLYRNHHKQEAGWLRHGQPGQPFPSKKRTIVVRLNSASAQPGRMAWWPCTMPGLRRERWKCGLFPRCERRRPLQADTHALGKNGRKKVGHITIMRKIT